MSDSNFPSVSQQYDPANVEEVLEDFRKELLDEQELAEKLLVSTSEEKLAEAQKFLNENKDRIAKQHVEMLAVRDELEVLVAKNQQLVAADQAYHALVQSDEYRLVAKQLAEIKAVAKSLDGHLKSAGVRGRASEASSSSSSSSSSTDAGERSKGERRSKKAAKSEQ